MKKSVILKAAAVLMVIFGILSTVSNVMLFVNKDAISSMASSAGVDGNIPTYVYMLGIAVSVVELVAGIVGLVSKSRKTIVGMAVILILVFLANTGYNIAASSFSATYFISLILPVVYAIGAFMSQE